MKNEPQSALLAYCPETPEHFCAYFYFNLKEHVHVGKCQSLMMKEGTQKYVQMGVMSLLNAAVWYLDSVKLNSLEFTNILPQDVAQEISA